MTNLIAEDLLLLLLDDDKGTTPMLWVDVQTPLAAALVAELAVEGAIELEPDGAVGAAQLRATGGPVVDPLLARALRVVAEKPGTPDDVIARMPDDLFDELAERQVEAGVLERHEHRVLGLFPRTTWPTKDASHEEAVCSQLRAVLVDGAEPDARTAVLAGLLGALDRAAPAIGAHGSEAGRVQQRASAIAQGEWASEVVAEAIRTTMTVVFTPVYSGTIGGTAAGTLL